MEYIFAEEFEFILTSLLQISNRTKFFQYRSMTGGRFLVSLTEVCTSEKNLAWLKMGDKYHWETKSISQKGRHLLKMGDKYH